MNNNRYKKIVFEIEEGISFSSNETNRILLESNNSKNSEIYQTLKKFDIEASEDVALKVSEFGNKLTIRIINLASKGFTNPPIPEGYKYITGKWNDGFVIERVSDGSQFTWIPVMALDANAYIPGKILGYEFGKRNFLDEDFSTRRYSEPFEGELLEQWESIRKYGGFYISRYNISKVPYCGPSSVKGVLPWTCIDFHTAKKVAESFETRENLKSHLTYGAEYDAVLQWLIETRKMSLEEVAIRSTDCGNFSRTNQGKVTITGSNECWKANNIYDFAGNVSEWTQEKCLVHDWAKSNKEVFYRVVRGGNCYENGPVAKREAYYPNYNQSLAIGFRIALCIK